MLTLPTALTKIDVAALQKADDICVHLRPDCPEGIVRAIKRRRVTPKDPYAQDVDLRVTAAVVLEGYRAREAFERGTVRCFTSFTNYGAVTSPVNSILRTLRAGDQLVFRFYADAEGNGYSAAAHLHADALYLDVYRKGHRHATWLLDVSICAENSTRMCQGVDYSEYLQKCADARSTDAA